MAIRSENEVYEQDLKHNKDLCPDGFVENEKVLYVNDYGVCFIREILGFSDDGKIHFKDGAYWFGAEIYHVYKLPYDVQKFDEKVLYDLGEVLQPIAEEYRHYYNVAEYFRDDVKKYLQSL